MKVKAYTVGATYIGLCLLIVSCDAPVPLVYTFRFCSCVFLYSGASYVYSGASL